MRGSLPTLSRVALYLEAPSRQYPVGGTAQALHDSVGFYYFFNSPASFHGDDCSFDACAELEREREIRGRYCIKLGLG